MAPQRGRDGLLSIETLIAGLYGVFFSIRRHLICMWLASTETTEASARHLRLTCLACVPVCAAKHTFASNIIRGDSKPKVFALCPQLSL